MWTCRNCDEAVKDDWDVCWKCGTSKSGVEDPTFAQHVDAPPPEELVAGEAATGTSLTCLRCHCSLKFLGRRSFENYARHHSITQDFVLAVMDVMEQAFSRQESLDVYCCPQCGKVELFVSGIGDAQREG